MRKLLTLSISLLFLVNLQAPYSHCSNSTDIFETSNGGDEEGNWSTIIASPTAFFSYCFAALLFETGKYAWTNRAKIGQCFGSCFGSACNKFSETTGLFYQDDEHDLDSVLPPSLPSNLTTSFKALHDALLDTENVKAEAEDDGDWYYQLGDRSYGIFNVSGLPGARELFRVPTPLGEVLNRGDRKLYKLLTEAESRTLITTIGRRNHKLEEKVLAGFHDWFTSGKLKIIGEGNVHYVFIGDYYEVFYEDETTYEFRPQILFRVVMGAKPTSDIFDEDGNLSFNMSWHRGHRNIESEDYYYPKRKKRKKLKKTGKKKRKNQDEYDEENPQVPFYHNCKKGWCHPDDLSDDSDYEPRTPKIEHPTSTTSNATSYNDFADIDTGSD